MQVENRIEAGAAEIRRMSPADYSAMKEKLIREARVAQAAAIRAAFARFGRSGRSLRSAADPSDVPAVA